MATVAMAEIDRQVGGRTTPAGPRSVHQPLAYDRGLEQVTGFEEAGELVAFSELLDY